MILLFPFPKIQVISGSEKKYLLTDYDEYKIEWLWGFFRLGYAFGYLIELFNNE